MKRVMWVMVLFVLVMSGLYANGQGEKQTTITLMRDAAEMLDEVIAAFEAKYPDIKVNVVENDFTKLMTMIAGGNPPDIFRVNGIGLPYWIRKGLIKDITIELKRLSM